jgi:hypothetical protein
VFEIKETVRIARIAASNFWVTLKSKIKNPATKTEVTRPIRTNLEDSVVKRRKSLGDSRANLFSSSILILRNIFLENVEGLAPATGSAPPIQVEVCSYPQNPTRGG